MNLTITAALEWAEIILRQLGAPVGHTLDARTAAPGGEAGTQATKVAFTSRLRIGGDARPGEPTSGQSTGSVVIVLAFDDGSSTSVLLEESMTEAEAVALLAEQLQESVLEHTGGAAAPPCPGHNHPAAAKVVEGVATWTCPQDSRDRARPILPARS